MDGFQPQDMPWIIKTLLNERYKDGVAFLKEILQNANDAQAKNVSFGILQKSEDNQNHEIFSQHRILYFLNDGKFTTQDREAISRFGMSDGHKSQELSKLGKFGLGQKSVFHVAEVLFYSAKEHLNETKTQKTSVIINPWSGMRDQENRPQNKWIQDFNREIEGRKKGEQCKSDFVEYLKKSIPQLQKMVDKDEDFFILCLPLRDNKLLEYEDEKGTTIDAMGQDFSEISMLESFFHGEEKEDKNKFNFANQNFTVIEEMCVEILPILNSLQSISFGYQNTKDETITPIFTCSKESEGTPKNLRFPTKNLETLSNENIEGTIVKTRYLQNEQKEKSNLSAYYGIEKFDASIFPTEDFKNIKDLQQHPYWPKLIGKDNPPDKALPHFACILSKGTQKTKSSFHSTWNVFLPLSEKNTKDTCKGLGEGFPYRMVLHGYFFLDSGRINMLGWNDLTEKKDLKYNDVDSWKKMSKYWNTTLAKKGTLSLIMDTIDGFFKVKKENPEVEIFLHLFRKSNIWTKFKEYICSKDLFVYALSNSENELGFIWQKKNSADYILIQEDDEIQFTKFVLTSLAEVGSKYIVVDSRKPNLIPSQKKKQKWTIEILEIIFSCFNVDMFCENDWHFVNGCLKQVVSNTEQITSNTTLQSHILPLLCKSSPTTEQFELLQEYLSSDTIIQYIYEKVNTSESLIPDDIDQYIKILSCEKISLEHIGELYTCGRYFLEKKYLNNETFRNTIPFTYKKVFRYLNQNYWKEDFRREHNEAMNSYFNTIVSLLTKKEIVTEEQLLKIYSDDFWGNQNRDISIRIQSLPDSSRNQEYRNDLYRLWTSQDEAEPRVLFLTRKIRSMGTESTRFTSKNLESALTYLSQQVQDGPAYETYESWIRKILEFHENKEFPIAKIQSLPLIGTTKFTYNLEDQSVDSMKTILGIQDLPNTYYSNPARSKIVDDMVEVTHGSFWFLKSMPYTEPQNFNTSIGSIINNTEKLPQINQEEALSNVVNQLLNHVDNDENRRAIRYLLHKRHDHIDDDDVLYYPTNPLFTDILQQIKDEDWIFVRNSTIIDLLNHQQRETIDLRVLDDQEIINTLQDNVENVNQIDVIHFKDEDVNNILRLNLNKETWCQLPFHKTHNDRRVSLSQTHVYFPEEAPEFQHQQVDYISGHLDENIEIKYGNWATSQFEFVDNTLQNIQNDTHQVSEDDSRLIVSILSSVEANTIPDDRRNSIKRTTWYYHDQTFVQPSQFIKFRSKVESNEQYLLLTNLNDFQEQRFYNFSYVEENDQGTLEKFCNYREVKSIMTEIIKHPQQLQNCLPILITADGLDELIPDIPPEIPWVKLSENRGFVSPNQIYILTENQDVNRAILTICEMLDLYTNNDFHYDIQNANHRTSIETACKQPNQENITYLLDQLLERIGEEPNIEHSSYVLVLTTFLSELNQDADLPLDLPENWSSTRWVIYRDQDANTCFASPDNIIRINDDIEDDLDELWFDLEHRTLYKNVQNEYKNILLQLYIRNEIQGLDAITEFFDNEEIQGIYAIGQLNLEMEGFDKEKFFSNEIFTRDNNGLLVFPLLVKLGEANIQELRDLQEIIIERLSINTNNVFERYFAIYQASFVERFPLEEEEHVCNIQMLLQSLSQIEENVEILEKIHLPDQNGRWTSTSDLTADITDIHPSHCLPKQFHDCIVDINFPEDDGNTEIDNSPIENVVDANNADITNYFLDLQGRLTHRAIGLYLTCINPKHHLIGQYIYEDYNDEIFNNTDPKQRTSLLVQQHEAPIKRVNLLGQSKLFTPNGGDVEQLHNITPKGLRFVVHLRVPPTEQDIREIIKTSAYDALQKIHNSTFSEEEFNRRWEFALDRSQMDILLAREMILSQSPTILRQISAHDINEEIKSILSDINNLNREQIKRELREENEINVEDINPEQYRGIKDLKNYLCDSTNRETEEQIEMSDLIKGKMRSFIEDRGYSTDSVPFEIFQNADDAMVQLIDDLQVPDTNHDLRRFMIYFDNQTLWIFHLGRPINAYRVRQSRTKEDTSKFGELRNRFEQDLEKMLSLNISDKGEDLTGKFGLGFKSVFTVSDTPYIWSGDLRFVIESGFIPIDLIPTDPMMNTYQEILEKLQLKRFERDLTTIALPILDMAKDKIGPMLTRFQQNIYYLPLTSRKVSRVELIHHSDEQLQKIDFDRQQNNIEETSLSLHEVTIEGDTTVIICLKGSSKNRKIIFHVKQIPSELHEQFVFENCLMTKESLWSTVPIPRNIGLPCILNGDFHLTPGRDNLSTKTMNKEELANLGSILDRTKFERICERIGSGAEQQPFSRFLWNNLFVQEYPLLEDIDIFLSKIFEELGSSEHFIPSGLYPTQYWHDFVNWQKITYRIPQKFVDISDLEKLLLAINVLDDDSNQRHFISEDNFNVLKKYIPSDHPIQKTPKVTSGFIRSKFIEIINNEPMMNTTLFHQLSHCIEEDFFDINEELKDALKNCHYQTQQDGTAKKFSELTCVNKAFQKAFEAYAPEDFFIAEEYCQEGTILLEELQGDNIQSTINIKEIIEWLNPYFENSKDPDPKKIITILAYFEDNDEAIEELKIAYKCFRTTLGLGTTESSTETEESDEEDYGVVVDVEETRQKIQKPDEEYVDPKLSFGEALTEILSKLDYQNWLGADRNHPQIYHITHVENLISIFTEGKFVSRARVKNHFDSAAETVINRTNEAFLDYVRFYFRPKTPTQYHNEGLGRRSLFPIMCPVPIVIGLDIREVIEAHQDRVVVSRTSLADNRDIGNTTSFLNELIWRGVYCEIPGPDLHFKYFSQREFACKESLELQNLQVTLYCRCEQDVDTLKASLHEFESVIKTNNFKYTIKRAPHLFFMSTPSINVTLAPNSIHIDMTISDKVQFQDDERVIVEIDHNEHIVELSSQYFIKNDQNIKVNFDTAQQINVFYQKDGRKWLLYKKTIE